MKIEEIEKSINTKYKKLLSEIERKNKFIFTNKENGLEGISDVRLRIEKLDN